MDLDRVHCKAGCISVINQRQNCKLNPFVITLLHYKKEGRHPFCFATKSTSHETHYREMRKLRRQHNRVKFSRNTI